MTTLTNDLVMFSRIFSIFPLSLATVTYCITEKSMETSPYYLDIVFNGGHLASLTGAQVLIGFDGVHVNSRMTGLAKLSN